MNRAYIVVGAESSGTRLLTEVLIRAGCHGSAEHLNQPWDDAPFAGDPVVWRRSIPHAGHVITVDELEHKAGTGRDRYVLHVVHIVRDLWANANSQYKYGHARGVWGAMHRIYLANEQAADLSALPHRRLGDSYRLISYESLVRGGNPNPQHVLCNGLGLGTAFEPIVTSNRNGAYYS